MFSKVAVVAVDEATALSTLRPPLPRMVCHAGEYQHGRRTLQTS